MYRNVFLALVAFCSVTQMLCLTNETRAEPILLAEWYRDQAPRSAEPLQPGTIRFSFDAFRNTSPSVGINASWSQELPASSEGQTFNAPSNIVQDFADAFASPEMLRFGGDIGPFPPIYLPYDSTWSNPPGGNSSIGFYVEHVENIFDYRITAVTRTVDRWERFFFGGGSAERVGGKQTIRFYGVPEPPTLWLLLACSTLLIFARRPTNPCC